PGTQLGDAALSAVARPYAVYTYDSFYSAPINFALAGYNGTASDFGWIVSTRCFEMLPLPDGNGTWRYDTRRLLEEEGYNLNFEIVLTAQLQFYILFDNRAHTGQVQVSLIADPIEHRAALRNNLARLRSRLVHHFDVSVILRTRRYFRNNFNYKLNLDEQCEFINLWFALIILNDLLTLIGSLMKILIEYKTIDNYTVCGLFSRSGAMLVWFGTLRYLGYFSKY
uniref:PKD_channel domain-containing protein n=1 Tax=Macrostomum lignano TaxID=282301 RepID=A0A1I8JNQ4_9PLAT